MTHSVPPKHSPSIRTFKKQDLLGHDQVLQFVLADPPFLAAFEDHRYQHAGQLPSASPRLFAATLHCRNFIGEQPFAELAPGSKNTAEHTTEKAFGSSAIFILKT
jgi:hypothetical protein